MELERPVNRDLHVAGVPRYTIDLDLPPKLRWGQVTQDYFEYFPIVKRTITELLGPLVESLATKLMEWAGSLGWVAYQDELKAIASKGEISVGLLTLMQLVYEAASACTSIVVRDSEGVTHHIRTMDWDMEFLKPLTIEYEFVRKGKVVYTAASWAGYVGIFTAMKPGAYSCSVNFRVTSSGTFWDNFKKTLNAAWPCGFLLRHVFETTDTMDEAVAILTQAPLIAPTFFTIAGVGMNDSYLITRERSGEVKRWSYNERGVIVQANVDWFMNRADEDSFDVMQSYQRRELARQILASLGYDTNPVSPELLWEMMSQDPICNGLTVYGCYMCPGRGILQVRIPTQRGAFLPLSKGKFENAIQPMLVPLQEDGLHVQTRTLAMVLCVNCNKQYNAFANVKGQCAHPKSWHALYDDCNYVKCAFGLGKNIGQQHWGCCHSTDRNNLVCVSSGVHQPSPDQRNEAESGKKKKTLEI